MRGSSMPDVGDYNERVVLQNVRHRRDGIAQVEIADRSGLSRQAVSLIVRRLLDAGRIEVAGTEPLARGKPRTLLRIAPRSIVAAGVHVDPVRITLVILDVAGDVLARRSLAAPTEDAHADIARIAQALSEVHAEAWSAGEAGTPGLVGGLLGIGVAAPGALDTARGRIVDPPWLRGWRDVPVAELLAETTGLPVGLDKDTTAALTGELWAARRSEGTHLYLYVGSGVGSALAVDGVVHRGASDQAGEIGHLPTGIDDTVCGCGREGCLGLYTDVMALVGADSAENGNPASEAPSSPLEAQAGLQALIARAKDGDPTARGVLTRHGRALGIAVRALVGIHDPELVTIGGPAWAALEEFSLPEVERHLSPPGRDGAEPELRSSTLGGDVGAIGAASLVLDRELSPQQGDWRRV